MKTHLSKISQSRNIIHLYPYCIVSNICYIFPEIIAIKLNQFISNNKIIVERTKRFYDSVVIKYKTNCATFPIETYKKHSFTSVWSSAFSFSDYLMLFLDILFPALCRNSRGKIRLLGRLDQQIIVNTRQNLVFCDIYTASQIRLDANLSTSTPSIAMMATNAFFFDWSPLPRPFSPGPDWIRMQTTYRLKKVMTVRDEITRIRSISSMLSLNKPVAVKQNSHPQPALIFLILTPLSFLSFM